MSKKKAPVLWVVVDNNGHPWIYELLMVIAESHAESRNRKFPDLAPFRVVKYLPAPKKRKNRK